MISQFNEYFVTFSTFLKANPVVAGAFSLWGLSVITFIVIRIPQRVYYFLKRQFTTSVTLNSQDKVFYDVLDWIEKEKTNSFIRNYNFNNSRFGWGNAKFSIGYGSFPFLHNSKLCFFNRYTVEGNQTEYSKEKIDITVFGRNQKILRDLYSYTVKDKDNDINTFNMYIWKENNWVYCREQNKRNVESIVLDSDQKNRIFKHIDDFQNNKEWYLKNSIPYRTGLLFYGPPGTGKTSIVKTICSKYNKNLCIIDSSSLTLDVVNAFSKVPKNSIILIEDIDAFGSNMNREDNKSMFKANIAELLNAIDGIASPEDTILIATTNYKERLDKALIRKGRFDLHEEITFMTENSIIEYIKRFYEDIELPNNLVFPKKLTPAELQVLVLENINNPKKVLKFFQG